MVSDTQHPHGHSTIIAKSAFCACSRFSASSQAAELGPHNTSSVISSPQWAGRQCSTTWPGAAARRSAAFT